MVVSGVTCLLYSRFFFLIKRQDCTSSLCCRDKISRLKPTYRRVSELTVPEGESRMEVRPGSRRLEQEADRSHRQLQHKPERKNRKWGEVLQVHPQQCRSFSKAPSPKGPAAFLNCHQRGAHMFTYMSLSRTFLIQTTTGAF